MRDAIHHNTGTDNRYFFDVHGFTPIIEKEFRVICISGNYNFRGGKKAEKNGRDKE